MRSAADRDDERDGEDRDPRRLRPRKPASGTRGNTIVSNAASTTTVAESISDSSAIATFHHVITGENDLNIVAATTAIRDQLRSTRYRA